MLTRGIRGAITLEDNTEVSVKEATCELLDEIIKQNNIEISDIAFCIFTVTSDIDAAFPAKFARLHNNFAQVPMMCYREMDVKGAISMCLRVAITKRQNTPDLYEIMKILGSKRVAERIVKAIK